MSRPDDPTDGFPARPGPAARRPPASSGPGAPKGDASQPGVELSEADFTRFGDLIYRLSGIRVAANKRILITNRIRRRLRATGNTSFADYFTMLASHRGHTELPLFLEAVTTNETYFDRDPHHYAWFGDRFLPEVAREALAGLRPRRLRVWSAACSTGEELYSTAIRYLERRDILGGWSAYFLGTDLSGAVLAAAAQARYDDRSLRLISAERRKRFFETDPQAPGAWTLKPEVRALATWKSHNLMRRLDEPPFDCIFLKNVLIYFDLESKRTVVEHLQRVLAPGGYLVVGPTEGVTTILPELTKLEPWLYRRPADPGPRTRTPR